MSKPLPMAERFKAIRRHPRLLAKGLYITAVVGLIGGALGQIFSTNNWVGIGSNESPLPIALVAGLVAAVIGIWKDMFKKSLSGSDNGELIEIGIARQRTDDPCQATDDPWTLSQSKIIFLCAAALVFVVVMLLPGGKLSSFAAHSTRSIIGKNAQTACRIATDVHLGRISDKEGTLRQIAESRQSLTDVMPKVMSESDITDDKLILLGSLGMLDRSEQAIAAGINVRNDPGTDAFFVQTLPACQTQDAY